MDINNRVRLDVPSMAFPVFSLKDEDPNYIEVGDFAKIYNHDFYDDEFMVRITRIELPFYITGVIPLRDDEFPFTVKNIRVLIKRRQAEKNGGYENQSLPLFNAGAYRWISTFEKFKTLGFIQNEWPDTLVLRRKNVDLSVVYGLDFVWDVAFIRPSRVRGTWPSAPRKFGGGLRRLKSAWHPRS